MFGTESGNQPSEKYVLAPAHSPTSHVGKMPRIVDQLETMRAHISSREGQRDRRVQPNLIEQKLMVTKAFARKYVKQNIKLEVENLIEKIVTGDDRLLGSKKSLRPFTAGVDGADADPDDDGQHDSADGRRPNTTAAGGRKLRSPKRGGTPVAADFDPKDIKRPILEELDFPNILFDSIVTRNKSFQFQKVFRNAPPLEIEVERPRDIIVEDLKSVPKKQRVGMALLVDPNLNTNGKDIVLKVTYDVQTHEPVPGASAKFNAKYEKPTRYIVQYSIRGNGHVFGMKITQSLAPPFPGDLKVGPVIIHNLTGTNITEEEMEITGAFKQVIPGWQGLSPIFIPYHVAKFELLEANDLPFNSISLGVFMCQNLKSYYKNINNYIVNFTLTRASNRTLDGGIPTLHLAAWKGDMNQLNLLLSQGANIDGRSRENRTSVLHDAIQGGHIAIVNQLLLRGANQNITDDSGNVPLHLACQLGNITIAINLMKGPGGKKALQVYNKKGLRPLDMCASEFLKQRVEDFMRAYLIVIKQRTSIIDAHK